MTPSKESIFLINKFKSILKAAFAVEAASFLVTFVDSLIAGNFIGPKAMCAVGLVAPLILLTSAISSVINSGTMLRYSYFIGKFDRKNADRIFSQGVTMSLVAGTIIAVGMFLYRPFFIKQMWTFAEEYAEITAYWNMITLYLCLDPLSCVLDNTMISEGGEKVSALANVVEIIGNIILSVLFAYFWELQGIAVASILCKVIFLIIVFLWYFLKSNVKYRPRLNLRESVFIIKNGVVKASTFAFAGAMGLVINRYGLLMFGENILMLLTIAERFLGMVSFFLGLSMASQALIGTLKGEGNNVELLSFAKSACKLITLIGFILSLVIVLLSPILVRGFGVKEEDIISDGTFILRMVGASLLFHAITTYFFVYYFLIEKKTMAFVVSAMKDFICPVLCGILFSNIMGSIKGLFIGLAISPIVACVVMGAIILIFYGKKCFPFLIKPEDDKRTVIYNYEISNESAVLLSQTITGVLKEKNIENKKITLVSVLAEELLASTRANNPASKKVYGECVILFEENAVKVIFRDSGKINDICNTDAKMESFRDYFVSQMLTLFEYKIYMTTMGYNRNEIVI